MIGWIIAGGVLLIFLFILFVHVYVHIEVTNEFQMSVRVLGIPLFVHPQEPKIKYRNYTLKKIRKREAEAARRAEEKRKAEAERDPEEEARKNAEKKAHKAQRKAYKPSLSDQIALICDVLKLFCSKFFGKLHIKFAKVHVRVGAQDAMQAAVIYGVANQSVQYLVCFLQKICHVDGLKKADFLIEPDFLSDSIDFEIKMSIRLTVGHVLGAIIRAGWRYIRGYFRITPSPKHPRPSIKPPSPPRPDPIPPPEKRA